MPTASRCPQTEKTQRGRCQHCEHGAFHLRMQKNSKGFSHTFKRCISPCATWRVVCHAELRIFLRAERHVPGHALHQKGLQKQIAVGTLVSSQQRRALAVPRLNHWSTAGQPLVKLCFVPPLVCIGFPFFSCLRRNVQNSCLWYPGGLEGRLPSRPTEMSAPWFAQLRPAPPSAVRCADPTRPLCVRVLDSTGSQHPNTAFT